MFHFSESFCNFHRALRLVFFEELATNRSIEPDVKGPTIATWNLLVLKNCHAARLSFEEPVINRSIEPDVKGPIITTWILLVLKNC